MIGELVDIGMGDYRVSERTHICALYSTSEERDAILRAYMRSALLSGDKCFCVLDPTEAARMTEVVKSVCEDEDIDLTICLASRQLVLVSASEATVPSGRFAAADKIVFWKDAVAEITGTEQYQRIRAIGELTSSLRDIPGAREVVRWESELNALLPLYPQIHMCMYNLDKVGGAFLVDLVSTHPEVFIGGMLVENPYYLSPEEWLKRMQGGLRRLG